VFTTFCGYEQRRPPALQATFVKAEKRKEKYCDVMGHLSKMLRMCMLIIIDYVARLKSHILYKKGGAYTQHLLQDTLSYSKVSIPEAQYLLSVGSPLFLLTSKPKVNRRNHESNNQKELQVLAAIVQCYTVQCALDSSRPCRALIFCERTPIFQRISKNHKTL
jgi:hypothetical protein